MADKKSYRNIQFRKRTKRQQLITPTASLTSLLSGSTTSINASAATAASTTSATPNDSNRSSKKNKIGKKLDKDKPPRERWLLTRKTWKYMTDAGRRLIPDYIRGNGSDPQELKKIEEYFQQVCRSEPKFLPIFRRKQSFPGAMGTSPFRRNSRLRYTSKWFGRSSNHLAPIFDNKSSDSSNVSSSRNKFNSADESDDDGYSPNDTQRMFLIIEMLEKYLKLSSDTEPLNPDGSSSSPVEYDSSAVTSPDNLSPTAYQNFSPITMSPDDQQPGTYHKKYSFGSMADSTKSSANTSFTSSELPASYRSSMTSNRPSSGGNGDSGGSYRAIGNQHTSLLLESLRNYGRRNRSSLLSSMDFTPAVLEDKQLLRRIRDELKQQQLESILNRHSHRPLAADASGLRLSTSMYMLPTLKSVPQRNNNVNESKTNVPYSLAPIPTTQNDSLTENVVSPLSRVPLISIKCASQEKPIYNKTECTQTDPIPVNNIYQYYHEYMKRRKENEEAEKQQQQQQQQQNTLSKSMSAGGKISISDSSTKHSKRKSSLDNEDISQSVSDTIKRYLRMARKKPTNDNDANRFKRINYDTNLRNIVPKAEIPKPDELNIGNTKSIQTNDDWTEIVINEIKMQMSANDNKYLPLSDCTEDYQRTITNRKSKSSSTPTSPTGLFHTSNWSKEFLFGGGHKKEDSEPSTNKYDNTYNLNMQKSKSSTNVGQSFTKKIWKSRSKSQTRPDSPAQPHWTPQGNCIWKSSNGNYLQMKKTALHELSEVERKSLQRIALDRINQLNIGVPVKLPLDSAASDGLQPKATKRRAPLLLKRKALTTGFFDSSKIKSDGRKGSTSNASGGGLIFGQPLEKCLSNDNAFGMTTKQKGSDDSGGNGLSHKLSRKSRSSITSLDNNQLPISSAISSSDGNYSGSCDSLFSKNDMRFIASNSADSLSDTGGYPNSLDDDDSKYSSTSSRLQPQVPPLILSCIDHLSTYGLNVVGIFRVSTSKRRIRELREELDSGTLKTFDAETSPHDVASLLKEYLRDLPEPLLCRSLYPAFLSTQKIRNRRLQLEALSHLIQLLPIAHRDTLFVLLKFLAHVARCSDDVINLATNQCISVGNKMDSANLATVIAPNILHSNPTDNSNAVATDDQVEERLDVINVVRTMIDHYEELFSVPADVMDDVYTNMMDSSPEQLDYIFDRRERIDNRKDDSSVSSKRSPSAIQLHTHFFPQHSQERIDLSDLHESSRTGITTATNDDTDQPRRMYVREQFTHENTVRGNVAESNDSIIKRRERGSRTKSLIPEHEVFARRRRRDKIPGSSSNSSSPNADEAVRYNLSISQPTTPTSKTAPDQKLNPNEIVLASLKLPVQMINQTDMLSTVTPLNLTSDLSDIPYIEDSDNNSYRSTMTSNRQPSITQSASTSSITKNLGQSMKKCSFPLTKLKSQYKPAQLTLTTVPIDQSSKDPDKNVNAKQPSSNVFATEQKTHSVPISTGITNIGGDVMRSKTAEFERMLNNQSRHSNQMHYSGRGNESKSIATTTKQTDSSTNARNGPIYKRRDVISSASNVKK